MKYEDIVKYRVGTTSFEMGHFIIGSALGDHRMIRQIVLEATSRESSLTEVKREKARKLIDKEELEEKIENSTNSSKVSKFDAKRWKLDLDEIEQGIESCDRRIETLDKEIGFIKSYIDEVVTKNLSDDEIKDLMDPNNEYQIESKYWEER
ncbi:MAG: hypothetical protein ACPGDB_04730, partial [Fusobacterium sp.]